MHCAQASGALLEEEASPWGSDILLARIVGILGHTATLPLSVLEGSAMAANYQQRANLNHTEVNKTETLDQQCCSRERTRNEFMVFQQLSLPILRMQGPGLANGH